MPAPTSPPHIAIKDLTMAFGDFLIQKDLTFDIRKGDIFIIMGGSGCGKAPCCDTWWA
jgi:phospholipid/cholesterol/gamma-HCH transport system ATP-binding protein